QLARSRGKRQTNGLCAFDVDGVRLADLSYRGRGLLDADAGCAARDLAETGNATAGQAASGELATRGRGAERAGGYLPTCATWRGWCGGGVSCCARRRNLRH